MHCFLELEPHWGYKIFESLRQQAIGIGSSMSSLAMSVASFIVAFQLLRLAYSMMSDENGNGFGGIRLSQFIRPIILLIVISNVGTVVGVLDNVCSRVTDSIVNAVPSAETTKAACAIVAMEQFNREINEKYGTNSAEALQANYETKKIAQKIYEEKKISHGFWGDWWRNRATYGGYGVYAGFNNILQKISYNNKKKDADKELITTVNQGREEAGLPALDKNQEDNFLAMMKQYVEIQSGADMKETKFSWTGLFQTACVWVFETLFKVVLCFTEISLCLLAILFPWALVLSLIGPFKNSWAKLTGNYLQLCFYKVIAAVIFWIITSVKGVSAYGVLMSMVKAGEDESVVGLLCTSATVTAIMCVAGIFGLFKLGSIAALLIGEGGIGDLGGAGMGAAASIAKAAGGGIFSAPGRALGAAGSIKDIKSALKKGKGSSVSSGSGSGTTSVSGLSGGGHDDELSMLRKYGKDWNKYE